MKCKAAFNGRVRNRNERECAAGYKTGVCCYSCKRINECKKNDTVCGYVKINSAQHPQGCKWRAE